MTRIRYLSEKYSTKDFCLGGGVALNCLNNGKLINSKVIDSLGIFPACGDDGISIGAGIWAIRNVFKDKRRIEWEYSLGKKYVNFYYNSMEIARVSEDLYNNKIIGIFEDGIEYGPRALCKRSIIASAKDRRMKDILNQNIKHREHFRPFGGVILERNLKKITDEKTASPLMLSAIHVKSDLAVQIPALIHKDNTVRIQVVCDNQKNSSIWKILDYMERYYNEIVLINTSFNCKDEPIVETISDAILSGKRMGLEYIFIGGERVMIC